MHWHGRLDLVVGRPSTSALGLHAAPSLTSPRMLTRVAGWEAGASVHRAGPVLTLLLIPLSSAGRFSGNGGNPTCSANPRANSS